MKEKFKNYKISKKLIISYSIVLVLLVLGFAVSIGNLISIGKKVENFYNGPFIVSESANVVNSEFEKMQKSVFRAISNQDKDITNNAIQEAKAAAEVIQQEIPTIREHFLGDMTIVENLENSLTKLKPMRETVLQYAVENKNVEAAQYMEENNIIVINEAQGYLDSLINTASQKGETLITDLENAQTMAVIVLLVLGAASVGISIWFARYITKSIADPVAEIEAAADNLSQGILDTQITYVSEDELGRLARSMKVSMKILSDVIHDMSYLLGEVSQGNFQSDTNAENCYVGEFEPLLQSMRKMNGDLSDTMRQINEVSEQVAMGSTQMAENAQNLAEGATEQAGSVEELNAVIEDVAGAADESANETKSAYIQIESSARKAKDGTLEMQKLTQAMERIDATSKEIGNIIEAIEDIASQTNLLSLNASIEAARAGEAGRGFAVVADQIGKLAADSAQSAVNTRELIEKTLQEIAMGNEITVKTSQTFNEVITTMEDFAVMAKSVSDKSTDQSSSLKQVKEGIEQISGVVQSNSASAEETSATSEELAAQSDNLKMLISRFRLQ